MKNLSAFLKTSVVATSVFAAFSVTAIAETVPPFAGIAPFPTGSPYPYYTGSTPGSVYKIPDGKDYALACNTTYSGALDVSGTTGVKIRAAATCAAGQNPVIIPGAPINGGWTLYDSANNIYVKTTNFQIGQVFNLGQTIQLVGVAHYPDSINEVAHPSDSTAGPGWLQLSAATDVHTYDSASAMTINYQGLPSGLQASDLVGAKVTYRGSYPWSIGTRDVSSYNPSTGDIGMAAINDLNLRAEDASNIVRFYLEGKRWMLSKMASTSSGWAFEADTTGATNGGKLYLRLPSGQNPNNLNIWGGAPVRSVINAQGATSLTISNVRIVGGEIGVDGSYLDSKGKAADQLNISNSEISYSNWSAIYASNVNKLVVDSVTINGALHSGIYARVGTVSAKVTNSIFNYVNNLGMHKGGDAAVYINYDVTNPQVDANQFNWVGKEAVSVGQSIGASVSYNLVTGACRNHGDCGAIYLFSPSDLHSLKATVKGNNVKYVNGEIIRPDGNSPERYSIYLDDWANGVLVQENVVQATDSGMQIHNGFNNTVIGNTFAGNAQRDIAFTDSGWTDHSSQKMGNNLVYSNHFNGPEAAIDFAFSNGSGNQPPVAGVANPAATLYSGSNVNTYSSVISNTTPGLLISGGPNWVKCADQYGTCSFSGTHTVRYGTSTSWVSKVVTGSVVCSNATFGDPAVGSQKECDYDSASSPAPVTANWSKCAAENETCVFYGPYTVRYGTGSSWVTKTISDGTKCTNSVFGDPAYGYTKECDIDLNSGAVPSPTPTTWSKCADEYGTCSLSGTHVVRYGTGSNWFLKSVTGSITCNDSAFGDPAYGKAKECDVGQ